MIWFEYLIITIPLIILLYIVLAFIWAKVQYEKSMRHTQKFNDFHQIKLIPWLKTIKDPKIQNQYIEDCLDLLHEKMKTNNYIFDEDKEVSKIKDKYGKYIPELQQENREDQIEKILSQN